MSPNRGDVVLVDWPFSSGTAAKPRPALIVQNDRDNGRLTNVILAMITTVIHRALEPTQLLIEIESPDGSLTGLHRDSVVNCLNLFTIEKVKVLRKLGSLSPSLMRQVNGCLRAALELP